MGSKVREFRTNEGCIVLETTDEIVLSTPPSNVIDFPRRSDLDWLMRAVSSTPYAEVTS